MAKKLKVITKQEFLDKVKAGKKVYHRELRPDYPEYVKVFGWFLPEQCGEKDEYYLLEGDIDLSRFKDDELLQIDDDCGVLEICAYK